MAGEILYCERCGKLIPPEEAEAEDYASLGVAPLCLLCLEHDDPGRRRQLADLRSTRLRLRARGLEGLRQARPPAQLYPPRGSELPLSPTSTDVRLIREDLERELGDPVHPGQAARDAAPDVVAAGMDAATDLPSVPPPRAHLGLWALLGASVVLVVVLLFWPTGASESASGAAPPDVAPTVPEPAPERVAKPAPPAPPGPASAGKQDLADVELIVTLARDEPDTETAVAAIRKLKAIAASGSPAARASALDYIARYEAVLDARAREAAREAAERAEDLADQERFSAAMAQVQQALAALPAGSPWAQREGRARLIARAEQCAVRSARRHAQQTARLEALRQAGDEAGAKALAEDLRRHPEAEFRLTGERFLQTLAGDQAERLAARQRREEAAQKAWPEFFRAFDAAVAAMELVKAAELCRPPADSPLRRGGVEKPDEVLAGFAAEVDGVRALYELALQAAKAQAGRTVSLSFVTGRIDGTLAGTDGRQLVLVAGNKVEVKVAVEKLTGEGLSALLMETPRERWQPALALLALARGELGKDPAEALRDRYRRLGSELPAHWARRFDLVRVQALRQQFAPKLAALQQALLARDAGAVRTALTELRAMRAEIEPLLTPAEKGLLAAAAKLGGPGKVQNVVFQNARLPTPNYVGCQVDQINAYFANTEKTDVDTHHGLKVGSHQDLQRVLVRFDGLETFVGKGTVRRATLELYETDAPQADGAFVALYRLKKAWTPDAASWLNADQRRKVAWQKPGASGPEDVAAVPEAQLILDAQKGLWRSWDVTAYVKDVVEGKAPNLGLLLRVARNEPRYDVRFYPDTDLENQKDPALRPRLVVEYETAE